MRRQKVDFARIKSAALNDAQRIAETWAPGGRNEGAEYVTLNPRRSDHAAGSFKVNTVKGVWRDFATDEGGADLVSFVAYVDGVGQGGAARRLAAFLGIPDAAGLDDKQAPPASAAPEPKPPVYAPVPPQAKRPPWVPLLPVPDEAPEPPAGHPKRGAPAVRYTYRDAAARLLFIVDRHEAAPPAHPRKDFFPACWCRGADGRHAWRWQSPEAPRPLYRLDALAASPDAVVIVAEGEKAADALAVLAPNAVGMSWPGGSQAIRKVDFGPLVGRDVILWPDADEPGAKAMHNAAQLARAAGAASVRVLNLATVAALAPLSDGAMGEQPRELLAGWDAADALAEGWAPAHFAVLLAHPEAFEPGEAEQGAAMTEKTAPAPNAAAEGAAPRAPAGRFTMDEKGLWLTEVTADGTPKRPRFVCEPFTVRALARSPTDGEWGLALELSDPDGNGHRIIVPFRALKGEGAAALENLMDRGLVPRMGMDRFLVEYLRDQRPIYRARVTGRVGWHEENNGARVFVLPDVAIGAAEDEWLYQADGAASTFRVKGTARQWREKIGALCVGNSRLLFGVSCAFAAPLVRLLGIASGAFHFTGSSKDGKSTVLLVAASVCGSPDHRRTWRSTDNGTEFVAAATSDALLILDELKQCPPAVASEIIYMLGNDQGKTRGAKVGGVRDSSRWRLLALSAGEIGITAHLAAANLKPHAGQLVRFAEVPSDAGAGHGAFEELHNRPDHLALAKDLIGRAGKVHGAPFLDYLDRLTREVADVVAQWPEFRQRFEARFISGDAGAQARDVVERFALASYAGELATSWGLTGWPGGAALDAAGRCCLAWLAVRGGEGNQEERNMLDAVREFLERYGEGAFSLWHRVGDDRAPKTPDAVGVRRWIQPDGTPITRAAQILDDVEGADFRTEYFILPTMFRTRVAKGLDADKVARMLIDRGCMQRGEGKNLMPKVRLPGLGKMRCYHVLPTIFGDGGDDAA